MIIIDMLIILMLVWGFSRGFSKGFVITFLSLIALIVGFTGALKLTPWASGYFINCWDINSAIVPFVTFLLVFIIILILIKLTARIITGMLNIMFLGFINKLAGGIFGIFISVFIISVLLWICNQISLIPPEYKVHSWTYRFIEPIAGTVIHWLEIIVPSLDNIIHDTEQIFDRQNTTQDVLAA